MRAVSTLVVAVIMVNCNRIMPNRALQPTRAIVELGIGRASAALAMVFGPRRKSATSSNRTYR